MTPQEIIKQQAEQQRKQVVNAILKQISGVVASGYTLDDWAKIAVDVFATNPKLVTCSTVSLIRAFSDAMEAGLRPNSKEGYCYIIPFRGEATFVMGYYGLLELAYRTGMVRDIRGQLVYANDEYSSETQNNAIVINHKYNSMQPIADRGKLIGGYAILRTVNDGTYTTELSYEELEQRRLMSPAAELEVWRNNRTEMYKKTLLRNLIKYVRKQWEDRSPYTAAGGELAATKQVDSDPNQLPTDAPPCELRSISEEPNNGAAGSISLPVWDVGMDRSEGSGWPSVTVAKKHAKNTNPLQVAGADGQLGGRVGSENKGGGK